MDTFDAIAQRRSVKHYDAEHVMPDEDLNRILEAAIQSPTSFNMQNWRFVVVRDRALRQELCAAAMDQAQVADASVLIIMTADLKAWERDPQRYWVNAPAPVAELLVNWMGPFYEGKDQLQRDEAMRSCGLAGMTVMLAAKALGYDSCPMIGFDPEKVAELIRLPSDHVISLMIAVGKRTEDPWPRPGQLPLADVVVHDRFAG